VERKYTTAILELLVVIFGILIAFQIERWVEARRDRQQEYEYLLRLKEDLQLEIGQMDQAYDYAQARIDDALFLEQIVANPSVAITHPKRLPRALETANWRSFPQISAFVYSELQSSGNLALIRSEELRRSLADHYVSIRHFAGVGLDLDIQHQFDRLTAGILTTGELRAIEDESWQESDYQVTEDRAIEIAAEFARRQEAIDLLPNMVQHHVFNQKAIDQARKRALEIIVEIDTIIRHF
jgi:hypothetical protein